MPFYEYRCTACEHEFEALQKMSAEPLIDCPACKKDSLTKLISAAGFQLKGSGWYATDFKDKPKKADKKTEEKKTETTKKTETKASSS